jgi:protein AbiQ
MRDKIDFKKIMDDYLIGVLNFNLMIPVEDAQIKRIDTKIRKHDNSDIKKKKQLLIRELEWCNKHRRDLINTANVLYQKYVSGENFSAKEQCLDFRKMERECCLYNERLKQNKKKAE